MIGYGQRLAQRGDKSVTAKWKNGLICVAIAGAVAVAFAPVLWNGFVYFDDDAYITENPRVAGGLTLEAARWALGGVLNSNWHPLTWWSHMIDVSLFGMAPWGHHLHSLALHAANACLVFALLRAWGVGLWPAALSAALWAVHPLRVESVAWASERKDLLCAFYGLFTLLAYDRRARGGPWWWLIVSLAAFALGLMAKPMLVTLPCVMLVLDVLVYRRTLPLFSMATSRAVGEKLPFFLLVGGSVAITLWAQRGAMQPPEVLSLGQRVVVALLAVGTYLRDTLAPTCFQALTPLYPLHSASLSLPWAMLCVGIVALVSLYALLLARRSLLPLAGWLLFLGMLVPVLGILQVGNQSHADRYTYLPAIGLALIFGWLLERSRVLRGLALPACIVLMLLTSAQSARWRDTESLFTHTLAHTRDNAVAHNNLGRYLLEHDRAAEAMMHLEEAVRLAPANPEGRFNLGSAYLLAGEPRRAISMLAPLMPYYLQDPAFHLNLALAMRQTGDPQFPVVAENALQLLPPGHPARQGLLDALGQAAQH